MLKKPTIGLFTSVEGHQSIAEAIRQTLADEFDIQIYFDKDNSFDFYVPIYKFFPAFFTIPFRITSQKQMVKILSQYVRHKYQAKIQAFYRKYRPELLLSTYFMYNPCLQDVADKRHIPFINIITDPRTIHPLFVMQNAQANVVFDQFAQKVCAKYSPNANLHALGWFVREEYEQAYNQTEVPLALHLNPDTFTILIVSGSEGTNTVATIFPALLKTNCPVQVLVACGNNKMLYQSIKTISQYIPEKQTQVTVKAVGFTPELYRYMQAADLVVGKAGPNTLFESVATHTPFFATTHIAGQEDGNLDIIRDYHLGYVQENVFKAHTLLRKIIRNPKQLDDFQTPLKKMADYNIVAKKQFKQLVRELWQSALTPPKS